MEEVKITKHKTFPFINQNANICDVIKKTQLFVGGVNFEICYF